MSFKSGFIAIVGRPNVGKSTLLNVLTNQKIAITSDKPQTTRHKIVGICHESDAQYIFVDTPGINQYKYLLNQKMNQISFRSISDVDVILFVTDSFYHPQEKNLLDFIFKKKKPLFLVINKIDILKSKNKIDAIILSYLNHYPFINVIPLSAVESKNIPKLKSLLYQNMQKGVPYYPQNIITDQKKEFLMSEIVREKILYYVHEEVPHAATVVIEKIKPLNKDLLEIWVLILVEKNSQKQILIGAQGSKLKAIGSHARKDLNAYFNIKSYLHLWVKVVPNWRNQKQLLSSFGF
ncbi:GTPase Era [Candidatus Phytoplasma australiense]|uniref:GTPase Era n=1 Tax=Strawberry lethal yellows phytoplasma (CPA) str. NZSb11 TaxID=980422 RepID=R4RWU0_PHYAS|nr:GTPase Era [Candidatus Phytoplasma australiense]AGL90342.1 GTP-binding protein era-like protein [Strawberry lethal yellows phytoplasma (CPA) str. NZSb11]